MLVASDEAAAEKAPSRNQSIVMSINHALAAYAGEKFDKWCKKEEKERQASQKDKSK